VRVRDDRLRSPSPLPTDCRRRRELDDASAAQSGSRTTRARPERARQDAERAARSRELLQAPAALAPDPGGLQVIGEVSLSAEAFGVHPGMRLGEALARCPRLKLVPPDPAGVADTWERLLVRLEAIGAAGEP